MIKKADAYFNALENIAKEISQKENYDANEHLQMLDELKPPMNEENIDIVHMMSPYADYNNMHPQLYIYPNEKSHMWKYIMYDPKDLQPLNENKHFTNKEYEKHFSTGLPLSTPIQQVINHVHKLYPTATIDFYETEAEMLKD